MVLTHHSFGGSKVAVLMAIWMVALGCNDDLSWPARLQGESPKIPNAAVPRSWVDWRPCPEGWVETGLDSGELSVRCAAWADAAPSCGAWEMPVPGKTECLTVGAECQVDGWPADVPEGAIYVKDGAAPGGDGSKVLPFDALQDGLDVAEDGSVIALSEGTFTGAFVIENDVRLIGACPEKTRIEVGASQAAAALVVSGASGRVESVSVGGASTGILVDQNGRLEVFGVVVDGATTAGIDIRMRGWVGGEALIVRNTKARVVDGTLGVGVLLADRGALEMKNVLVEGNRETGIYLFEDRTTLVLEDSVVRDTLVSDADGEGGFGVAVLGGADTVLRRVVLSGNRARSIWVSGKGSTFRSRALEIVDTKPNANNDAFAMLIEKGADVDARYVWANGTMGAAFVASGEGTNIILADVYQQQNGVAAAGESAPALLVTESAQVEVVRFLWEGNVGHAIAVSNGGALHVADGTAVNTAVRDDGTGGGFLLADSGSTSTVARVVVRQASEVAFRILGEGTKAKLNDVIVLETKSRLVDGRYGRGLEALAGAKVTLARCDFSQNRNVGAFASGEGTRVEASHLRVGLTEPQACELEESPCALSFGGIGLGIYDSASMSISGLLLDSNDASAVQIASGGTIDLRVGEVTGNLVGVNVQTVGFDESRLTDRVEYFDNGMDVTNEATPIPNPIE